MSKLLMAERPLQVLPSLVKIVGIEKAIILQQIHWMLQGENSGKYCTNGAGEEHKYIWKSAREFSEQYFPFWKPDTIRKHIKGLEELKILVGVFMGKAHDRTKYYRIDADQLARAAQKVLDDEDFDALVINI